MTPSIAFFLTSTTLFVAALFQCTRGTPNIPSLRTRVEQYLRSRLDQVLTPAHGNPSIRDNILRLLKDPDFRLALQDLEPNWKSVWRFVGSGIASLLLLAIYLIFEARSLWFEVLLTIPLILFGLYCLLTDALFYKRLEKILSSQ